MDKIYAPQQPCFYLRLPKESPKRILEFKKTERRSVVSKREGRFSKRKNVRNQFSNNVLNGLTPSENMQLWFIAYAIGYRSVVRTCWCSSLSGRSWLGTKRDQQLPSRAEGPSKQLGHGGYSGNTFLSALLPWYLVAGL